MQGLGSAVSALLFISILALSNCFRLFHSFSRFGLVQFAQTVPVPEFSRPLHISKISAKRAVLCKIIANENERKAVENRLGVRGLKLLAANMTLKRDDNAILVAGKVRAELKYSQAFPAEHVETSFLTKILNNHGSPIEVKFEENDEYDDQVDADGNIDLGEIAVNYLAIEL